ncbi:hypothetical protein SeMB42_g03681 [Synchytrium endobioticum]|uniref:Uncharacterized protein n=1 Tax=Synchytrium endobioticum TaxID=286115 RepID=A0A507D5K3_9FUNG|nr:hypothetical protein SeMB42_g03681 [Synchytrium endobioticum]
MAMNDYQWEDAVAEISNIVVASTRPLSFVPQDFVFPFEATPLFALLPSPENEYLQGSAPYRAFAGQCHLLLLWRCMQELSLLQWLKNRYVTERMPEYPGLTSEQVDGAITEMTEKAKDMLQAFDAYEKAVGGPDGKPHTSRLSGFERQEFLGLIGGNRLTSTWKDIIREDADKYIKDVNSALANVKSFYVPTGVDSLAYIQHVDGISPQVHYLISACPPPENLPPRYLELATKLHFLMANRLQMTDNQQDHKQKIVDLEVLMGYRWQLFSAYNLVSGVFSHFHAFSWGDASPNTGDQIDILGPATSAYSCPYDSTASGSGARTRADFEGGSSSGERIKKPSGPIQMGTVIGVYGAEALLIIP